MNAKATDSPDRAVTYRIRDWEKHFENNRTREMVKMAWVPVPNKHDGEGFQRIMREKDGLVIYGCWHLILQVASKCLRERGTLMRDDGTPLDAAAIAIKTGWRDSKDIARALAFLSSAEVGWIERLNETSESIPQEGAAIPQEGARNGMELNGTELNGTEDSVASFPACDPVALRIGTWFKRRPSTKWHSDERKAYKAIGKPDEDDLAALEAFYTAEKSAVASKDGRDYRRTSVLTLLRHWPGEVDKARRWKSERERRAEYDKGVF